MKANPGQGSHALTPHRLRLVRVLLASALAGPAAMAIAETAAVGTEGVQAPLPTALSYDSAVAGYQPYADQPVQSWREANDRAGRIGGWRAYAREIMTGVPAGTGDAGKASSGGNEHMNMGGRRP